LREGKIQLALKDNTAFRNGEEYEFSKTPSFKKAHKTLKNPINRSTI